MLPGAHVVRVHMSNRARTQHFTIGAVHTWRLINMQKVTELAIALWNSETNPDSFWAGKDSTPNSFAQRRLQLWKAHTWWKRVPEDIFPKVLAPPSTHTRNREPQQSLLYFVDLASSLLTRACRRTVSRA